MEINGKLQNNLKKHSLEFDQSFFLLLRYYYYITNKKITIGHYIIHKLSVMITSYGTWSVTRESLDMQNEI